MPENTYGTIITAKGSNIIADCILSGKKLTVTKAAAGDGNGTYYVPTVDQTALKNEKWRGDIASAELSALSPNMIDVKVVIPDDVGGFTIREMALFDEGGTMIAVCNIPDTQKVAISGGMSGKLTMLMHIIVADASVVEFTITPTLDTVTREELESAITDHNASSTCHADIRSLALNSVQHGEVYTKVENEELLAEAIAEHNAYAESHPSIQVALANINSRIATLELKYGTQVTGNSFEVTFENLGKVEVTGVWNETYARIEF